MCLDCEQEILKCIEIFEEESVERCGILSVEETFNTLQIYSSDWNTLQSYRKKLRNNPIILLLAQDFEWKNVQKL